MINYIRYWIIVIVMIVVSCKKSDNTETPITSRTAIRAADLSMLMQVRQSHVDVYNLSGQHEDMLVTLKNEGMNVVRLRLWVNPTDGHSGFNEVKTLAKEIKNLGLQLWLTVHYSDTWADPGAQTKPNIWGNISFEALKDSMYQYTSRIVEEMDPDYIQIGNEINHGLLWPEGNFSNVIQMKALLQSGIRAVRDHSSHTKIMIHFAGYQGSTGFFTSISDLDFDVIAISYYPVWHGKSLSDLQNQLVSLSNQFNKSIVIAETSYPFTLGWNDLTNNTMVQMIRLLLNFLQHRLVSVII